jgi:hypothetical protein
VVDEGDGKAWLAGVVLLPNPDRSARLELRRKMSFDLGIWWRSTLR